MPLKSPESEFVALAERSTERFAGSFCALLSAVVRGNPTTTARERCAAAIGETMTLADLFGRRRVFLEQDFYERGSQFAAASPVMPNVPFSEAYRDILSREPRLLESAEAVAQAYTEGRAFALARSAEATLTEAVQNFISRAVQKGKPAPKAATAVQELGDFTRSYAQTVYRTNLTTAYTAGRFQQAQDPGVRKVLPAMERWGVTDSAIRQGRREDHGENHFAAVGLIAATRDVIWAKAAPPSGYGCRCGVRMVPRFELEERGLIRPDGQVTRYEPPQFSRFKPHPRFGQRRPDLMFYS